MSAPKVTNEAEYREALDKLDAMWDRGDIDEEFQALDRAVQEYERQLAESPRLHPVWSDN